MIIFTTTHAGNLVSLIALRYSQYADKDSVLLISKPSDSYQFDLLQNLEKNNIFNKCLYFEPFIGTKDSNTSIIVEKINNHISNLLIENKIELSSIETIVSASDIYDPVGMWAALNRYPIILVESVEQQSLNYSRYGELRRLGIASKEYESLQKELAILCGENTNYGHIYYDTTGSLKNGYYNPNELSVIIPKKYHSIIVNAFGLTTEELENVKSRSYILLMNSPYFINDEVNRIYTEKIDVRSNGEYFLYLYLKMIDYLNLDYNDLLVKPHPYCLDFVSSPKIPGSYVMGKYPIEVLNLVHQLKIKEVISLGSSSLNKMKNILEKSIDLFRFAEYMPYIDQFMYSIQIIKRLITNGESFGHNTVLDNNCYSYLLKTDKCDIVKVNNKVKSDYCIISIKGCNIINYDSTKLIIFFDASDAYISKINALKNIFEVQLKINKNGSISMKKIFLLCDEDIAIKIASNPYVKTLNYISTKVNLVSRSLKKVTM